MVTSSQIRHRGIGRQLADFVRAQGEQLPTYAALQGVVSYLAAGDVELVLPLKHLIALPGFRAMANKAGSGTGLLDRDALLESLGDLFSPRITGALGEVLNGFLDLPDRPSPSATEVVLEPDWDPRPSGSAEPRSRPPRSHCHLLQTQHLHLGVAVALSVPVIAPGHLPPWRQAVLRSV